MPPTVADRRVTRSPSPFRIRTLDVVEVIDLAPAMRRIVLGGEELEHDFPLRSFAPAEHVKIVIPDEDTGLLRLPTLVEGRVALPEGPRPTLRDYTVRAFDPERRRLTIDFVLHPHGPAGRWAASAAPGRSIGVAGPRGSVVYPTGYARYVLIADDTALPALSRWIEEAPRDAQLVVRALVDPRVEGYRLPERHGMDAYTLASESARDITRDLTSLITEDPDTFVWAAGEATSLTPLRQRLRDIEAARERYDIDGYWKLGAAEFDHHAGNA